MSSGGQNLSVEGYYITVGQFSDFLEGLISVSAHCALVGVGTISPNHGRLSQMDPFDPKVNYLEGFLPTSNPQLTPALPTQPTYRLGYRLRGQSWRELGFRATGL